LCTPIELFYQLPEQDKSEERFFKYNKLRNILNKIDDFKGENRILRPPVFAWPKVYTWL